MEALWESHLTDILIAIVFVYGWVIVSRLNHIAGLLEGLGINTLNIAKQIGRKD